MVNARDSNTRLIVVGPDSRQKRRYQRAVERSGRRGVVFVEGPSDADLPRYHRSRGHLLLACHGPRVAGDRATGGDGGGPPGRRLEHRGLCLGDHTRPRRFARAPAGHVGRSRTRSRSWSAVPSCARASAPRGGCAPRSTRGRTSLSASSPTTSGCCTNAIRVDARPSAKVTTGAVRNGSPAMREQVSSA